jgi:uncharacterized linocin/CFP29 family protein
MTLLTAEQYVYVDASLKRAARQVNIARKLMPTFGPVGFETEVVKSYTAAEIAAGRIDLLWGNFSEDLPNVTPVNVNVPVLSQGFRIPRRALEASRRNGTPLDTHLVDSASYAVAKKENALAIQGWAKDGTTYDIKGLYQGAGNSATGADMSTATNIPVVVFEAMGLLIADGINPPYNLVLHPTQYAETFAIIANTGMTYNEWVRNTIQGEIFSSTSITASDGMMLAAPNPAFFDLTIGIDMTSDTEEMGLEDGRDLFGVVYECVVPRIHDSNAICTIGST